LNDKNKTSLHYDNDEEVSSCKMWCDIRVGVNVIV